ncbi:MAG TPA: hypothetical protein VJH04_00010 [archaeon]|nr:hypothetical protein [archaeon]
MKQIMVLYIALIVLAAVYLLGVESVTNGSFSLNSGGRDTQFTFYDLTLFVVFAVSLALAVISYSAYNKKQSNRLFFVALAFFLFMLKSVLKIVDNFVIGNYSYIGISIQTLELLILLSLFYAIFKK